MIEAFNGNNMRELATQFLALAEKQGASAPVMVGRRAEMIFEAKAHFGIN
jgi:hypothetical protein